MNQVIFEFAGGPFRYSIDVARRIASDLDAVGLVQDATAFGQGKAAFLSYAGERESRPIAWPIVDSLFPEPPLLTLYLGTKGPREYALFVEFAMSFRGDAEIEDIRLYLPFSAFCDSYDEEERDVFVRGTVFAGGLVEFLQVPRVRVFDLDYDHDWFAMTDGRWDSEPQLPLEAADKDDLKLLEVMIEESSLPITFDKGTGAHIALVPSRGGDVVGLLRRSPLNGALLPVSSAEHEFFAPDEKTELKYLQPCWTFEHGLDDVITRFGPPDSRWGEFSFDGRDPYDHYTDINDQLCYSSLEPNHIVVFRRYISGRIAVDLIGKLKA